MQPLRSFRSPSADSLADPQGTALAFSDNMIRLEQVRSEVLERFERVGDMGICGHRPNACPYTPSSDMPRRRRQDGPPTGIGRRPQAVAQVAGVAGIAGAVFQGGRVS